MSIVPLHDEAAATATCPHCGAAVSADQRYCLSCGRPCSPLRQPFLEVLGPPSGQLPGAVHGAQNGYLPALQRDASAPLQRYTGLFSLIAVLLLTGAIGLLIGHWVGGSGGGAEVIKVQGLSGLASPAAAGAVTTSTSSAASAASKSTAGGEEHESKQEEKETAASNLKPPVKPSAATQKRLSKLTGKRYEQEINKLANGNAPIETGG